MARGTPKNAFFFEKFYRGHDPPHPRRSLYTPPVDTPAPAHPERLHITGSRAGRSGCKADHAGQIGTAAGCWMAGNRFIVCIMVVLPLAWFIGSNMHNFR